MIAIRTAGLRATRLEGGTPFELETALNAWLETRQANERVLDIQYLHAPVVGEEPDTWVAMILYATQ
jgi:hypothetical protein